MKKIILILCFLILPQFLVSESLNCIFKKIVAASWTYGYTIAKDYDACFNYAVNTLNKTKITNSELRVTFFKLINSTCKIGINDRIQHTNNLNLLLKRIDILIPR